MTAVNENAGQKWAKAHRFGTFLVLAGSAVHNGFGWSTIVTRSNCLLTTSTQGVPDHMDLRTGAAGSRSVRRRVCALVQ